METKGIEQMTKEELIDLVGSLNKELESAKKDLTLYRDWKNKEEKERVVAENKIKAMKLVMEVL